MGFLWYFVKLNRTRGLENNKALANRYRDLISEIFTKSYNVEEDSVESAIHSEEDDPISNLVGVGSLGYTCGHENHAGVDSFTAIEKFVEKQYGDRLPRTAFAWDVYSTPPRQEIAKIRESVMSAISANPTLAKSMSTSSSMSSMRIYSKMTLTSFASH